MRAVPDARCAPAPRAQARERELRAECGRNAYALALLLMAAAPMQEDAVRAVRSLGGDQCLGFRV